MTFLNFYHPAIFLLVLIPVLIHLLIKSRKETIVFPSIIFLKDTLNQKSNRVKFSQLLLLIVRTFIVLLVIFAGMQPVIKTFFPFSSSFNVARDYIIILDNSLSMQRTIDGMQTFSVMKNKLLSFVEHLNKYDRITLLLSADKDFSTFKPYSPANENMKIKIDELKPSFARGNLRGCYNKARNYLNLSKGKNKTILIFSDFQDNEFRNVISNINNEDTFLINIPEDNTLKENNFYLSNIKIKSSKGNNNLLLNFILNKTAESDRLPHLTIKDNSFIIFEKTINITNKNSVSLSIPLKEFKNPKILELFISGDDFFADNIQGIVINKKPQINILIPNGAEDSFSWYLRKLFNPDNSESIFKLTETTNLSTIPSLDTYHCLFIDDPLNENSTDILRIKEWVKKGGTVFFAFKKDYSINEYNSFQPLFAELMPFTLKKFTNKYQDNNFNLIIPTESFTILDNYFDQDAFKHISRSIMAEQESDVLFKNIIQTSSNKPYLSLTKYQQGNILWFHSLMNPENEEIIFSRGFLPLIHILTENLTLAKRKEGYMFAGGLLNLDSELPEKITNNRLVIKPKLFNNNKFGIIPVEKGLLKLIRKDKSEKLLYINTDPDESDISLFNDWHTFKDLNRIKINENIMDSLAHLDGEFALWRIIFILIFILLCCEALLTKVLRP